MALAPGMLERVKRIERVRLYPTRRQQARLRLMLDVTRELYNAALQERRDAYRLRGVSISYKQQYAELTALRGPLERFDGRLATVYRECEDAVLHRLDLAFTAFFRRLKRGDRPGHPRFKSTSRWKQVEFPLGDRALKFDGGQSKVQVPGIGGLRIRKGREVPAFGRAWLVERNRRWHACFECEREVEPLEDDGCILGIDRGVHVLAATSDGQLIRNSAVGEKRKAATARLQRELEARTVRDARGRSLNRRDPMREAAALRLARAREREVNARRNYLHKKAREIVKSAGTIALEALGLRRMTRSAKGTLEQPGRNVRAKAGLNRVMLDASFGQLHRLIAEKVEETARRLVLVDPRFSSQECARCGHIAKESVRRRRFVCVRCFYTNHRDSNAALVIRARAQSALLRLPDAGVEPVRLQNAA